MAEAAVVVMSRSQLAQRLAAWPGNDGEMTWGVVFAGAVPSAAEIAAMREAGKLCDRVVVVVNALAKGGQVAPKLAELCREAGGDVVWVVRELNGFVRVDCGVDGVEGTLMAQAVMTVLPTLVVCPRHEVGLVRALRNFQGGLGEVFSLRVVN